MTTVELIRLVHDEAQASPGFVDWLARADVSIAVTKGNSLCLIGRNANGSLSVSDRQYGGCLGLAAVGTDTLLVGTRFQIWRLENALAPGAQTNDMHDRLFLPQTAWTVGAVGVHDLALDGSGRVLFVNGLFSCLCHVSERLNFEPTWLPPFVSELAAEERCHLSGMAMADGQPVYVTAAARSDDLRGYRNGGRAGGVVVSVEANEVVAGGLSMPYTPRLHEGRLWLVNGGAGEVCIVDLDDGSYTAVAQIPGFARGLAFGAGYVVVGASRPRRGEDFDRLPLGGRVRGSGARWSVGLFVVDTVTGTVEHSLVFEGGSPEIHAIALLQGARSPTAVGFVGDDVQELVTVPRP